MTNRRRLLGVLLGVPMGALLAIGIPQSSIAQDRTLRIIVPYPAGGNADNISRLFADGLRKKLAQSVIIDNKPGAGATVGAVAAAHAPADGTVLFLAPTAVFVVTPHLRTVPYDPQADFVPIARLTTWIPMMVARKDFPANTFQEAIAEIRRHPGKYTFASAGPGTMTHLMGELINMKYGLKTTHVPYKGSADFVPDLMAGRVDLAYDSVVVPEVLNGQLKALASMVDVRHPDLPNVPTLKQLGGDLVTPNWYGLFAPKGTPPAVVERFGAVAREVVREMDKDSLNKMSMEAAYQDPAQFKDQIAKDDALLADVIKQANIKVE